MSFAKFTILNSRENASSRVTEDLEVLFNLDHIVSIKPIRISTTEKLVNGFWIRTTNGKKYKATQIPAELLKVIGEKYAKTIIVSPDSDDQAFQ